MTTYDYTDSVVWADLMTGETIAQSEFTDSFAQGSLLNVGYGGRLYAMGNFGDITIYQVTPAAE